MLPPALAPVLTALILSGLMSLIVSGVSTLRTLGLNEDFLAAWLAAWLPSYAIAFPAVLLLAPVTHAVVSRLVRAPE